MTGHLQKLLHSLVSLACRVGVTKAQCKVLVYFSLPFIFAFLTEALGNFGSSPNASASCFQGHSSPGVYAGHFPVIAAVPDRLLGWWPQQPVTVPGWRLRQSLRRSGNGSRESFLPPEPLSPDLSVEGSQAESHFVPSRPEPSSGLLASGASDGVSCLSFVEPRFP